MALIKKIRTSEGDSQIDYTALANLPSVNGVTLTGNVNLATSAYVVSATQPEITGNEGKFWIDSANGNRMYFNTGSAWSLIPTIWT